MKRITDTRAELLRAILRIEHQRPKRVPKDRCWLNISVVAREAGVTPACIHNSYPDLADTIRRKKAASGPSQLNKAVSEARRFARTIADLRERLDVAERDLARIASENARLASENSELSARLQSGNVVPLRSTPRPFRTAK